MSQAKRIAVFVLLLSTALIVALEASARTERLRWTHPGGVDHYTVHYGTETRVYTSQIDVGIPATDSDGGDVFFYYDLEVPDAATVYVAVTAVAAGDVPSDYSNERMRSPSPDSPPEPLGTPGRPTLILP